MGAAILENMPVTRSEDSTLFREILCEISRFVLTERPLAWDFAKFRPKCYGRTQPKVNSSGIAGAEPSSFSCLHL